MCFPERLDIMAQDTESEEVKLGGNECVSQVLFLSVMLSS